MTSYLLTEDAEEDLIEIWGYSANKWGVGQADRYQSQIEQCCETLSSEPSKGRTMEGMPAIQFYPCEKHFIFYTSTSDALVVIAVLHQQMDLPAQIIQRLERM